MPVFATKIREFRAGHDLDWTTEQMGKALATLEPGQAVIVHVEKAPPVPEGTTLEQIIDYLNQDDHCPFCEESHVEWRHDDIYECQSCGKAWEDVRSLTSIREVTE
jgi:hypothetical protein